MFDKVIVFCQNYLTGLVLHINSSFSESYYCFSVLFSVFIHVCSICNLCELWLLFPLCHHFQFSGGLFKLVLICFLRNLSMMFLPFLSLLHPVSTSSCLICIIHSLISAATTYISSQSFLSDLPSLSFVTSCHLYPLHHSRSNSFSACCFCCSLLFFALILL